MYAGKAVGFFLIKILNGNEYIDILYGIYFCIIPIAAGIIALFFIIFIFTEETPFYLCLINKYQVLDK